MKYRNLGRTGLRISEIGFGASAVRNASWTGGDKRSLVRAMIAAHDAGINFFDTAWVHGRGESERLLARVFGRSMDIIIASKVPPRNGLWPAPSGVPLREVFPSAHVLGFLRKTLNNLHRDAIDLFQFHVWNDEWIRESEWPEMLEQVRRTGWVRFIGISTNDHQPENALAALGTGMVDTVQVIYDFLDQSPEEHLFPYCIEHGIGVIARSTVGEGGLSGILSSDRPPVGGESMKHHGRGRRKADAWGQVQRVCAEAGISTSALATLALRFGLSHQAVSTVIPEMRTTAQVRDAAAAAEDDRPNAEIMQKLRLSLRGDSSGPSREHNIKPTPPPIEVVPADELMEDQ